MINNKSFNIITLLTFFNLLASAQLIDTSKVKLSFNAESQIRHQSNIENTYFNKVHIDDLSDMYGNNIRPSSRQDSDNPHMHAAFYSMLYNKAEILKKYTFELDILLEHRGISYGVFPNENLVVYPYFKFGIQEDIKLFNQKFNFNATVGNTRNAKFHQGLRIYNIDIQGISSSLNWKRFVVNLNHIGDLCNGIGLLTDEIYDHSIGYIGNIKNRHQFSCGINHTTTVYSSTADKKIYIPINELKLDTTCSGKLKYHNAGLWLDYKLNESARIYAQFEVRTGPYYNFQDNSAFLLGAEININNPNFSMSLNPEFRYYGWVYNYGHKDTSIKYRKEQLDENGEQQEKIYANTVGDNLYPLMNYNNNFSQWAVYTDYQYQNIAGIEFRSSFSQKIHGKFYIDADIESCTILKEYSNTPFTYLFYSGRISYKVGDYVEFSYGVNNKVMNLDKHYQTFYMSRTPMREIYIRYTIGRK